MYWQTLLTTVYTFCGIGSFAGFLPQLWRLYQDCADAASISLVAWGWWSFIGLVSVLYAAFIVKNDPLIMVGLGNFMGSSMVFAMAGWRRYVWKRGGVTLP